jgi:hypothetical protein
MLITECKERMQVYLSFHILFQGILILLIKYNNKFSLSITITNIFTSRIVPGMELWTQFITLAINSVS